jgi:hypothetical protein
MRTFSVHFEFLVMCRVAHDLLALWWRDSCWQRKHAAATVLGDRAMSSWAWHGWKVRTASLVTYQRQIMAHVEVSFHRMEKPVANRIGRKHLC